MNQNCSIFVSTRSDSCYLPSFLVGGFHNALYDTLCNMRGALTIIPSPSDVIPDATAGRGTMKEFRIVLRPRLRGTEAPSISLIGKYELHPWMLLT